MNYKKNKTKLEVQAEAIQFVKQILSQEDVTWLEYSVRTDFARIQNNGVIVRYIIKGVRHEEYFSYEE